MSKPSTLTPGRNRSTPANLTANAGANTKVWSGFGGGESLGTMSMQSTDEQKDLREREEGG